jgi:DNA-binding CsgD family transcriptional regulator
VTERLSSVRFVGRLAELAALRRLVRGIPDRSATVVVRGEAGVGKTRLVDEVATMAAADGRRVVRGGCVAFAEVPVPFGPIVEALRDLVDQLGTAETLGLLGPAAAELSELLPGLGLDDPGAERHGEASRTRLFETIRLLLERAAAKAPTLVIVEDVHWADGSTRDLLAFLAANLPRATLLLLTFRSDELPPGHRLRQFVAGLERRRDVTAIALAPLNRDEQAEQLTDICGHRPEPDLARIVWERSEGNPFFAEELTARARAGDRRGLPPTLHDLLLGRFATLSADGRRLLGIAAVGGRRVPHRMLAAVAAAEGLDSLALVAALREVTDQQALVSDDADYEFRHALQHEAAYADLLPGERIALHSRYGQILEQEPVHRRSASTRSELARHWFLAGDNAAALRAAIDAAHASEVVCGFTEAQQHLEHAMVLWHQVEPHDRPDTDHLALVEWTAKIASLSGDHRRAAALTELALDSVVEDTRRAVLYERLGRYLWAGGEGQRALAAYADAVMLVPEGVTAERSRVLAASARGLMLAGRHREAAELAGKAAAIAREARAATEEGRALGIAGFTVALLGDVDRGLAMLASSRERAELDRDPNDIAEAFLLHARLLSGPLCRLDEALDVVTDGIRRVLDLGLDRDHGVSMQALAADTLFRLGRWDETDALLSAALEHDPLGVAGIDLYLARGKLSVGRGDFEAARDDLDRASMMAARTGEPGLLVPPCILEAGLALWREDFVGARAAVDAGLKHLAGSDDPWLLGPVVWHGLRAEADASARSGDVERGRTRCAVLSERVATLRAAHGATTYEAQLRAYAAMCDAEVARVEGDDVTGHWSDVAMRWDSLGQPYPAAYARWKQAESLLAGGRRPAEARALLAQSHEVATRLGAAPFREAIERLASRARIDLGAQSSARPAPSLLTAREEQVLELVTTGASNRQIASALFISEKTVSVHVSNILAKLGARSRTEAAGIARQLGLTPASRATSI